MSANMGFGILGVLPADNSSLDDEKILIDFARQGWSSEFNEIVFEKREGTKTPTIYNIEFKEGKSRINKPEIQGKEQQIEDWGKACGYLYGDDWSVVFLDANTFLPNSTLGDAFKSYDLGDNNEITIASLEFAIKKINELKADFIIDELHEEIERMNDYLNTFNIALKNNFIVTFSY